MAAGTAGEGGAEAGAGVDKVDWAPTALVALTKLGEVGNDTGVESAATGGWLTVAGVDGATGGAGFSNAGTGVGAKDRDDAGVAGAVGAGLAGVVWGDAGKGAEVAGTTGLVAEVKAGVRVWPRAGAGAGAEARDVAGGKDGIAAWGELGAAGGKGGVRVAAGLGREVAVSLMAAT